MPIIFRFEKEISISSVESKPRYEWRMKDITDRKFRRHIHERLRRRHTTQQESDQDITVDELNRVIEEAGNNKAAGVDDIPYELIKQGR